MGSPLLSVVTDLFMEAFKKKALECALLKPMLYRRYVDDTLLVYPQGREALTNVVTFLNSLYGSITFTVEAEQNGQLPFLDILIKRHPEL